MRILYLQDGHCSGKNSENRIGNYLQDWKLKFEEVFTIAKDKKVDCIMDGGDLLHSSNIVYSISDYLIDIIGKSKIPYLSLYGNHCENFHDVTLSKNTTFYHMLHRCQNLQHLKEVSDDTCDLKAIEYTHGVEDDIKKGIKFKESNKFKIIIVHALITEKPLPFQASHVPIKDFKTNADLILIAHNHKPFDITINTTRFLDIGCFGRRTIDEKKVKPSVLFIDTNTKEVKVINLKTAKKGIDVFKEPKDIKSKLDIEEFMRTFGNIKTQGLNIREQIEVVGKELEVSREAIDLLVNKVD